MAYKSWRYLRMTVVEKSVSALAARCYTLIYYVSGVAYPTVNMTDNTTPSPLVASASYNNPTAFQVFDGDGGTYWGTQATQFPGDTLTIDFGLGNGIIADQVYSTWVTTSTRLPYNVQFHGSNDASVWTLLLNYDTEGFSTMTENLLLVDDPTAGKPMVNIMTI